MDPRSPIPFKTPDEFFADLCDARARQVESPFYTGLIAGACFAALVFAGGFGLVLALVR